MGGGMQKRALLSVSDKSGLEPFARALVERFGYELLSTGGTAMLLREAGLPVTDVSDYTGFPELMEGRLKTLHPKVHGGLLCRRDSAKHLQEAEQNGIGLIDLVVVNLYPFEATVAKRGISLEEAIENIDIGGPSMLRSAAKNHAAVTVVCDSGDYDKVLAAMESEEAMAELRPKLAVKVFQRTAKYDAAIAKFLVSQGESPDLASIAGLPEEFALTSRMASSLRYGENPHQQGALYGRFFEVYDQLQGKELSYCNILDISAATALIGEFEEPTVAILKHTNPCGVASGKDLCEAWDNAYATDRQAPFGGVIVVNQTVTEALAERIAEIWCEIIIAPDFAPEVLQRFRKKKNLRLMRGKGGQGAESLLEVRSVVGGFLAQDADRRRSNPANFRVVTKRQPTEEEMDSMLFGWNVVKHVKSNAIVYTRGKRTLGIGAGQMSRVDSSRVALWKAGEAGLSVQGSALCSDALIPFADGLLAAAEAGATACIQTGGSLRDDEVIAAADEHNMAMLFTGERHFKH